MMTSFPRSDRTSSIHFDVDRKDCLSADRRLSTRWRMDTIRLRTCYVIDHNCNGGVADIGGYKRAETFLHNYKLDLRPEKEVSIGNSPAPPCPTAAILQYGPRDT